MARANKKIGWNELRVGIFTLAALLVLSYLILNASGDFNPFERRFKLRARFLSADGLREGSEVQLAGVKIGKVESVKFLSPEEAGDAKVEALMSVSEKVDKHPINERIRTDSTAQLVATSVLGNDKMINITPGTPAGTSVEENHVLDSTADISINQLTASGNEFVNQLNKLAVPLTQIATKTNNGEGTLGKVVNDEQLYNNLNQTVAEAKSSLSEIKNVLAKVRSNDGTAGRLLNDPQLYNNLNATINQLETISNNLKNGKGTAGKLLTDDAVYNDARAAVADLRSSLKDFKPAIANLNKVSVNLQTISAELNEGKGTAGKLLKDEQLYNDFRVTLSKLNAISDKADVIISDAQQGKGTLGKLLTDDTLYNNLNQTSANINQLSTEGTKIIYDFRQNPKKYLTVQLKLF